MSCATLADASIARPAMPRWWATWAASTSTRSRRSGWSRLVAHSWEPLVHQQQRQYSEETLAGWLTFGRWITGLQIEPTEVRFQHPAPADTSEHRRIFGCRCCSVRPTTPWCFPSAC